MSLEPWAGPQKPLCKAAQRPHIMTLMTFELPELAPSKLSLPVQLIPVLRSLSQICLTRSNIRHSRSLKLRRPQLSLQRFNGLAKGPRPLARKNSWSQGSAGLSGLFPETRCTARCT